MGSNTQSGTRRLLAAWILVILGSGWGDRAEAQSLFVPKGSQQLRNIENFQNRVLVDEEGSHKYVVFVPTGYTPKLAWPTVLYLHGASNRGTDGRSQLVTGLPAAIRMNPEKYPFIVVFPQCEDTRSSALSGWIDDPREAERALKIMDEVEREFHVDRNHEVIAGLSMGACGVFQVAMKSPDRWRGLVAVSGKCPPEAVETLGHIPMWIVHAENDPLVPFESVREFVDALGEARGKVQFTSVSADEHDISPLVFTQFEFVNWVLHPEAPVPSHPQWTRPENYRSGINVEVPFIPGAEIPGAFQVRIASDVLEALTHVMEEEIGRRPLQGTSAPVRRSTQAGLSSFDVSVGGVRYTGRVEHLRVTPQSDNTLLIQLGIRNVVMTISGTQIDGLLIRANAGPMRIVIGHRAPVWMSVRLAPQVVNREVRLPVVSTSFQIPSNNWYVTSPAGVSTQGLPFMERRISESIVQGVYDQKGEIEAQFRRNVPQLLQQLERDVNQQIRDQILVVGAIPLPMWQPRLKLWPESIQISSSGITASLGITMAALGNPSPDFPLRKYAGRPADFPGPTSGVQVAVSSQFATAMSELLIAGNVNRFHAADLREKEFHAFADRKFLESMIPDIASLPEEAQLRVEFALNQPAVIVDGEKYAPRLQLDATALKGGFGLYLPSLLMEVAERQSNQEPWRPYGTFDAQVLRFYQLEVLKPDWKIREARFGSVSDVIAKGEWTFAPGREVQDRTVDVNGILHQIAMARKASDPPPGEGNFKVPDLPNTGIRLEGMHWSDGTIALRFERPPVVLINETPEPVSVAFRGPKVRWATSEMLLPGQSKEFRAPYLQTFWIGNRTQVTQLEIPPGEMGVINRHGSGRLVIELRDEPVQTAQERGNITR